MENRYNMEDKVFYNAGELVTIKHDLENRPVMLVVNVRKMKSMSGNSSLSGIECIWFDDIKALHKEVFSTKDLKKV